MPRAVDGTKHKDRRKKILDQAKGYFGRRSTNYRVAKDAVAKAGQYAYRGRKEKKRDFRKLWIFLIQKIIQVLLLICVIIPADLLQVRLMLQINL